MNVGVRPGEPDAHPFRGRRARDQVLEASAASGRVHERQRFTLRRRAEIARCRHQHEPTQQSALADVVVAVEQRELAPQRDASWREEGAVLLELERISA